MSTATPEPASRPPEDRSITEPRLQHVPLGAFAMVMGLAGTAGAWHLAGERWDLSPWVGRGVAVFALGVFALAAVAYGAKAVRFPRVVASEWAHPVKAAFSATIPVSLLVLAIAFKDWEPGLAEALWWAGAVGLFLITLMVLRTWIHDAAVQPAHIHPAWFIPVVGNLVAPIAGVDYAPEPVNWYFFGVGIVYWAGLLPVILTRLFTVGTLPARLAPTLAILVAPPAVAALAWNRLGGSWDDPFSRILVGVMTLQVLLLAVQANTLMRTPFAISSWAYSFPLAAASSAYLSSSLHGGFDYNWGAGVMIAATTAVVAALLIRTSLAARRGAICQPEG
ncbi:SLAC1 anion channel family protein [Demequina aurantiaca]|uniref:SLAC1 anion channel family protein n=1 Tax=Demequina aurantiaca TaxID=676200 RepID=UPI003D346C2C